MATITIPPMGTVRVRTRRASEPAPLKQRYRERYPITAPPSAVFGGFEFFGQTGTGTLAVQQAIKRLMPSRNMNVSSNRITIERNGVYEVGVHAGVRKTAGSASRVYFDLLLYLNGVPDEWVRTYLLFHATEGGESDVIGFQHFLELVEGDYLEVYVQDSDGGGSWACDTGYCTVKKIADSPDSGVTAPGGGGGGGGAGGSSGSTTTLLAQPVSSMAPLYPPSTMAFPWGGN